MNYYMCAYGHTWRISKKCANERDAALDCFGVTYRVTVLNIGPRLWRNAKLAQKKAWEDQLRTLHKEQTGNTLGEP
jgi:hypothetical protein